MKIPQKKFNTALDKIYKSFPSELKQKQRFPFLTLKTIILFLGGIIGICIVIFILRPNQREYIYQAPSTGIYSSTPVPTPTPTPTPKLATPKPTATPKPLPSIKPTAPPTPVPFDWDEYYREQERLYEENLRKIEEDMRKFNEDMAKREEDSKKRQEELQKQLEESMNRINSAGSLSQPQSDGQQQASNQDALSACLERGRQLQNELNNIYARGMGDSSEAERKKVEIEANKAACSSINGTY